MQYFSTNRISPQADFGTAALYGQPDDTGLYFPASIPAYSTDLFVRIADMPDDAIAFEVMRPFVGDAIDEGSLHEICRETFDFEIPLVSVNERISALELFHGPTNAFKDVGARFMSRCLRHFSSGRKEKTVVIVATSGDTGGAVAAGFHGVEGIEVIILYPKGRVSSVQEMQLTALGGNVTAIEVRGSFDECQALAKQALADAELKKAAFITSANSINVARWLPQQVYFLIALKHYVGEEPIFSVPSGNFGNICAGLLAHRSGMPAGGFIAACNANRVVPDFFNSGEYEPRGSIATLSNAMDVGDPSNFVRMLELFGRDLPSLKSGLSAVSISDNETLETIRGVYDETGYILDPHGAVAFKALSDHLITNTAAGGVFLATAHPVKFDSVKEILGTSGDTPDSVSALFGKEKKSIEVDPLYADISKIVLSRI